MKDYGYIGSCVCMSGPNVKALNDMIDDAKEITLPTFLKWAKPSQLNVLLHHLGYERGCGPSLRTDYGVTFHKSRWKGRRCVYLRHSSIEHIFVEPSHRPLPRSPYLQASAV